MLRNVDLTTSGKFRCEVSGEAPLFQTATHTNVLIVVGGCKYFLIFFSNIFDNANIFDNDKRSCVEKKNEDSRLCADRFRLSKLTWERFPFNCSVTATIEH